MSETKDYEMMKLSDRLVAIYKNYLAFWESKMEKKDG